MCVCVYIYICVCVCVCMCVFSVFVCASACLPTRSCAGYLRDFVVQSGVRIFGFSTEKENSAASAAPLGGGLEVWDRRRKNVDDGYQS